MNNFRTLFNPWRFATVVAYMLQSTEYQTGPYLKWFWRTNDYSRVMYRRTLDPTRSARLLRLALVLGSLLEIALGVLCIVLGITGDYAELSLFGAALVVAYPAVWAHLVVVPLELGRQLVIQPREARLIADSQAIFAAHPGTKIAVAGSYGKTSMKELLATVLAEGLTVAATPANKNVAISHAYFAQKLTGNEDVLIIEYGEGKPGDVAAFARTTHPTHGIITGLAPAHLDQYKTLEAAGQDIFALADYLQGTNVYVNDEPAAIELFLQPSYHRYNSKGALGWKVRNLQLLPTATSFELTKGKRVLHLTSGLLGAHQVGPLSLVAALALALGLTPAQVEAGIAKTLPYEHRMQPRPLNGGWVIDDAYNGNLEGVRAGTALLAALPAKRKLYVTPGLVDQGKETERVHREMGALIAAAEPDIVVLMQNSAEPFIRAGLTAAGYSGEIRIETDPLRFYTNLDHIVAAGDILLMQNDWTDNYS